MARSYIKLKHEDSLVNSGPTGEAAGVEEKDILEKEDVQCAGIHLLLEFWGAKHLDDLRSIEAALRHAAEQAGATIIDVRMHEFSSSGGVTGVAMLAESHISIHTWPE